MEAIEKGCERTDAENNFVATRRPRARQYIANLIAIKDLALPGVYGREREAGPGRTRRRRASAHEFLTRRTERRHWTSKPQFIVRIAAEHLLHRRRRNTRTLVKHNLFAVGRP